uniref:Uncharacterized protein n=1 Tax=Opuntia streptacantha TaxID=393608 RepID=A0A7C9E310_OPUST
MSKQIHNLFLEEWLRSSSGNRTGSNGNLSQSSNSSAQTIIQSWAELRSCLQQKAFHQNHLNALKALVNSQASLYVADPQAKLVISILSSPHISLLHDSYPLFLRLLYIWVRKSRPSSVLIDSAVEIVAHLFSDQFDAKKSAPLFAEGVLLVGAFSLAPSVSGNTKTVCLQLLCRMLEENYQQVGSVGERVPDILGGIGYALCSSDGVHFLRLLDFLLGDWVKLEVPHDISHALMILHLVEWVVYGFISAGSSEKISLFTREAMENHKTGYAMFAVLMAAAGALRASKRPVKHTERMIIVSRLRISAEAQMENVATDLVVKIRISGNCITEDSETSFLLHCLSVAVARSGGLTFAKGPLLVCLGLALVIEVFPLRRLYATILENPTGNSMDHISDGLKKHLDGILFKEAGAATGIFCTLYPSANEEDKLSVEDLVWDFCHDIYLRHRKVALLLRGRSDQLLNDLEKIAESAFLMTVVFALAVTKHKLNSKFPMEVQMNVSVKILASFSCLEYFRRIRVPEYVETIKSAVASVQANESAVVSFVQSLPSYNDLANPPEFLHLRNVKYAWYQDEVQTARILFYLRVIPTSVSCLPSDLFRNVVAATMFLYMGHPDAKVARASHAVFVSFISSEKESDQDERTSLKEQLVFYYMKRSLEVVIELLKTLPAFYVFIVDYIDLVFFFSPPPPKTKPMKM